MSASFISAMNTRADDNVAAEKTGFTIWVSNSCGQLFIFKNVYNDGDDGWDICNWSGGTLTTSTTWSVTTRTPAIGVSLAVRFSASRRQPGDGRSARILTTRSE